MKFQLLDSSSMKSYHFVCWNNMSNTPDMDEKKKNFPPAINCNSHSIYLFTHYNWLWNAHDKLIAVKMKKHYEAIM